MGKKRYWIDEDFAKELQRIVGKDALIADEMTNFRVQTQSSREMITCILHDDINVTTDRVDGTRLHWLAVDSRKSFQVVVHPDSTVPFQLIVNGITIGPFTASTTTASFRTALSAVTSPETPHGIVIHGNFFLYPVVSVTCPQFMAEVFEVPWAPKIGDSSTVKVGSRTIVRRGQYRRGSVQCAEYFSGYGFAISGLPDERIEVEYKQDLLAAVHSYTDPSTADAYVLETKPNGDLRKTPRTVQVVNRFRNISIDKGTYGRIERVGGIMQPYVADCPGDSASSEEFASE
jgi:hypothetical protein